MDAEEARTIGRRLRQVRHVRRKALEAIAGLAGISPGHLSRVERGERALDSLSEIVALANALEVAPSDLMRLPVPAPANGQTDSAINAVFLALMWKNRPGRVRPGNASPLRHGEPHPPAARRRLETVGLLRLAVPCGFAVALVMTLLCWDRFDDQFRGMAGSDPDRAADVLDALSRSEGTDERDVAAIYVTHLFATRQDGARDIVRRLLADPDEDVRRQVRDSLDEVVEAGLITATEAARLVASDALG